MYKYIQEFFSFCWYVGTSLAGLIIPDKVYNDPQSQSIVLVGGIGSSPLAFIFLQRFLEKKGFRVIIFRTSFLKNLGLQKSSMTELAKELNEFVEEKILGEFLIVGMSAGAILSIFYLTHFNKWKEVKKFIAISTPFYGSWLSYIFFFSKVKNEFIRNSNVLKNSIQEVQQHKEKVILISGKWDEFVFTKRSTIQGIKQLILSHGGHAYIQTFCKETFILLAELCH